MKREGVGSVIVWMGVLLSLATVGMVMGSLIEDMWYVEQSNTSGERVEYRWSSVLIESFNAETGETLDSKELSWSETGLDTLAELYRVVLAFGILACCFAFLCTFGFLFGGFLRSNYNWDEVAWADERNVLEARHFELWRVVVYFQKRSRHGRAMLWCDLITSLMAVLAFAFLLTAVTVFTRHPHAMSSDLEDTECQRACTSFVGTEEDVANDDVIAYWQPGSGWSIACATVVFPVAMMLVAVAPFALRTNRFADQDEQIIEAERRRAEPHSGAGISEGQLLLASSMWQRQEKVFYEASFFDTTKPFSNTNSTAHVDRDEL